MENKRDYYEVLGVSRNAGHEEIKSAYRKLAREHHPDLAAAGDKNEAEKRFKEINEAYQVLGEAEKKKMYDQFGHVGTGAQGFGQQPGGAWGPFTYTYTSGGFEGVDPFDIFEQVFGFRGFGGAQHHPRKGKNLFYEMNIAFVDAIRGADKEVAIESGKVRIKIPAGVRDGTEIRFEGKGMPGPRGLSPGDLFITVRVPAPMEFERSQDDVFSVVEIDFVRAVLGGVVDVPVVDASGTGGVGHTGLKIPQGTQPGTQFRLRGKGMPRLRGSGRGDAIVRIFVKIPKRITKEQKRLLEAYQAV